MSKSSKFFDEHSSGCDCDKDDDVKVWNRYDKHGSCSDGDNCEP